MILVLMVNYSLVLYNADSYLNAVLAPFPLLMGVNVNYVIYIIIINQSQKYFKKCIEKTCCQLEKFQ